MKVELHFTDKTIKFEIPSVLYRLWCLKKECDFDSKDVNELFKIFIIDNIKTAHEFSIINIDDKKELNDFTLYVVLLDTIDISLFNKYKQYILSDTVNTKQKYII
jgi:hypothetical protein